MDTKNELMQNLDGFKTVEAKKVQDLDEKVNGISKIAARAEESVLESANNLRTFLERKIKNHDEIIEILGEMRFLGILREGV